MLSVPAFLTFYAAVLALQIAPGPDMMLVIGRGVGQGRRVALLTAAGTTLIAALVQLPLLAFGVASLVQASPVAFQALRWVGGLYLVWLGVKLLLKAGRSVSGDRTAPRAVSDFTALREGAISSLTNPKSMVFMLAFLPQFVDPLFGWPVTVQLLILGTVQKLSGFMVMAAVALGAGTFGTWLARRPSLIAWQERFAGLVMVGLGLRLVLSGDARATR
ncbi:LysE family translocator [Lichenibacterium dinghuense]|uniref:LysE family translocator n=1 Tax=Lichenibacterium dinghuense TaxID=2895977 RepID=UPI001F32FC48|nr:LysE family translocator [Lichenibacterium sp. 6Y81]